MGKMMKLLALGALLTGAGLNTAIAAGVYKWVDAEGNVQYGEVPPGEYADQASRVETPKAPPPQPQQAVEDGPEFAAEGEAVAGESEIERENREIARQNCAAAQRNLEIYQNNDRIMSNGQEIVLTSQERQRRIDEARQQIEEACNR